MVEDMHVRTKWFNFGGNRTKNAARKNYWNSQNSLLLNIAIIHKIQKIISVAIFKISLWKNSWMEIFVIGPSDSLWVKIGSIARSEKMIENHKTPYYLTWMNVYKIKKNHIAFEFEYITSKIIMHGDVYHRTT